MRKRACRYPVVSYMDMASQVCSLNNNKGVVGMGEDGITMSALRIVIITITNRTEKARNVTHASNQPTASCSFVSLL
jgi:hypothetical protein